MDAFFWEKKTTLKPKKFPGGNLQLFSLKKQKIQQEGLSEDMPKPSIPGFGSRGEVKGYPCASHLSPFQRIPTTQIPSSSAIIPEHWRLTWLQRAAINNLVNSMEGLWERNKGTMIPNEPFLKRPQGS